jgi:hypothetical protein
MNQVATSAPPAPPASAAVGVADASAGTRDLVASLPDERGAAGERPADTRPADAPAALLDETAAALRLESLFEKAEKLAHVEGLAQEVALLRAAIHRLAGPGGEAAEQVKVLAELRHQVEALCTALKTQHALATSGDARAAELARALDELGDRLGVPQLGASQPGASQLGVPR